METLILPRPFLFEGLPDISILCGQGSPSILQQSTQPPLSGSYRAGWVVDEADGVLEARQRRFLEASRRRCPTEYTLLEHLSSQAG